MSSEGKVEPLTDAVLLAAAREAAQKALLQHERAGSPVALWQDDRVVWVPASEALAALLEGAPHSK